MTAALRQTLPPRCNRKIQAGEIIAYVKYFTPDSNWYWYGVEFDGDDNFFGLVFGWEVELGYFCLSDFELARDPLGLPLGLPIERDLTFKPTTLGEIIRLHCKLEGNDGRMCGY